MPRNLFLLVVITKKRKLMTNRQNGVLLGEETNYRTYLVPPSAKAWSHIHAGFVNGPDYYDRLKVLTGGTMLNDGYLATCENRRILVIDDNLAIHEDFRKILADSTDSAHLDEAEASLFDEAPVPAYGKSFEVSFADQGQKGAHMVEQAVADKVPYALAFVDMRMPPGWDGLQTIEQIWKTDSSIQVVICTAFSDNPWREIAARLGRTDRLLILRKPFDAVEVEQLAAALTCKWELAKPAELRMDGINALINLRAKELLHSKARPKEDIATRTLALSNHIEQVQQLNEKAQHFVEELRQAINTADRAN